MKPLGTEELVVEAHEGLSGLEHVLEIAGRFACTPNVAVPDVCVSIRDLGRVDDTAEWIRLLKLLVGKGCNIASLTFESGIDRLTMREILAVIIAVNSELPRSRGCHTLVIAHKTVDRELFTMPFLKTLDVRRASFRDGDCSRVLEFIAEGGTIQSLTLDGCTLGMKSLPVLLSIINEGKCPLRTLSVRGCGLLSSHEQNGLDRLFEAVGSSQSSLESLNLGDINLKHQEDALENAVENLKDSRLRRLELHVARNQLHEEAAAVVGKLLAELLTETSLIALDTNHFSERAEKSFWCCIGEGFREGRPPFRIAMCDSAIDNLFLPDSVMGRERDGVNFSYLDLTRAKWPFGSSERLLKDCMQRVIERCDALESLILNDCSWIDGEIASLLMGELCRRWEAGTCKLSYLSLANCPLGPVGCGAVVANLLKRPNHTLRRLDLRYVRGGAGLNTLRTLLLQDTVLEELVVLKSEWDIVTQRHSDLADSKSAVLNKVLPRREPLELPLRHALLYALSERSKQDGEVSLRFSRDVVTSILAFSVRKVQRRVVIKSERE